MERCQELLRPNMVLHLPLPWQDKPRLQGRLGPALQPIMRHSDKCTVSKFEECSSEVVFEKEVFRYVIVSER